MALCLLHSRPTYSSLQVTKLVGVLVNIFICLFTCILILASVYLKPPSGYCLYSKTIEQILIKAKKISTHDGYHFEDVSQEPNRKSDVWKFFHLDKKKEVGKCLTCFEKHKILKIFKAPKGTTKSMS